LFACLFSKIYESALSTFSRNKQACHFVTGFVATLGASLDEFAIDLKAILELKINNK
jgi:hypothetical protein